MGWLVVSRVISDWKERNAVNLTQNNSLSNKISRSTNIKNNNKNKISNKIFFYLKKFFIGRCFLFFTLMISNLSFMEDKEGLSSLLSSFRLTGLSSNVSASHVVILWRSASTWAFPKMTSSSSSSDETNSISSFPDSNKRSLKA